LVQPRRFFSREPAMYCTFPAHYNYFPQLTTCTVTTTQHFQPRFLRSIADIDASVWNALAGKEYPFLRHEFLWALESSGCTTDDTGWTPCHLLLESSVNATTQ